MIANPNNCRAYIECQQNLRLDRECGSGELFEARSGVCLSDFTVDCGDRSSAPPLDDGSTRNVRLFHIGDVSKDVNVQLRVLGVRWATERQSSRESPRLRSIFRVSEWTSVRLAM